MFLELYSSKRENRYKNTMFMWHKRKWLCMRIAIMLLFILFVLFCLDGEAYAHCKHIFPDEVMDLQGHFLSFILEIEKSICSEGRNELILSSFSDRDASLIMIICKEKSCFPINCCYLLI